MLPEMDEVHSVELSDELHAAAVRKFERQPNVCLHKGDIGKVLPEIVDSLTKPALIWLDAYYSAKVTATCVCPARPRTDLDSGGAICF